MPDQQSLLGRREWGFLSAEVKGMHGLRPREDYRKKVLHTGPDLRASQRTWDLEHASLRTRTLCSSPPNTLPAYFLLQLHELSAVPQTSHVFWHFYAFIHPVLSASIMFHLLLYHSSRFIINEPLFKPLSKLFPPSYPNSSYHSRIHVIIRVSYMFV